MPTTQEIADQLVALCRAEKNLEAIEKLYSDDAVTVEARGDETMPAVMTGRSAIRGKNEWWFQNHTLHRNEVRGPFPNGDRFAVIFDLEVTANAGPMTGKRMHMLEVGIYTVGGGQIIREEFFYDMEGASQLPLTGSRKSSSRATRKKAAKARPKARPAARRTKAKAKAKKRRR